MRFNKGKFFYLELNIRLFSILLFSRFDIVYAVDLDTLIPGRLVAALRRKTCVFDAHEYFTEVPELVGRPVSKKVWEFAARLFIPTLKHAITVCESLAMIFEKRYNLPFAVIRNVPRLRHMPMKPRTGDETFVLLYQGALNIGRGLEASILAMKSIAEAELWICGEGDLSEALRLLVKENKLEGKVKFLGKLPPKALAEVTSQAHLGLNLLENKGLNYYYSLANKAFDYIQFGLPSLNMAFPEYVRLNAEYDVCYLLETLSPETVAGAVNLLRSDKATYIRLANNCLEAAKQLNWELESRKLLAFFEGIP